MATTEDLRILCSLGAWGNGFRSSKVAKGSVGLYFSPIFFMQSNRKFSVRSVSLRPTDPFTISVPQDRETVEFYEVPIHRTTDFEAPKLGKGRSGQVK